MSKKHPLRIHVEHNEFRFDAEIKNATEVQNQMAPLLAYAAEQLAPIIQNFVTTTPEAAQAIHGGVTSFAETAADSRAEARLIERIADRVIEKFAALAEGDLERISCHVASAAGKKMKGSP